MPIGFEPVSTLLVAAVLFGLSGVPGLFLGSRSGQVATVLLCGVAAVFGLFGSVAILLGTPVCSYEIFWPGPFGHGLLTADHLSAVFFLLISVAALACPLYTAGYTDGQGSLGSRRRMVLFLGFLLSAMGFVLLTRNGVMLLASWEVMALSSWILVTSEYKERSVERAGLVYLITTHTATMALLVAIALLYQQGRSFLFPAAGSLVVDAIPQGVILVSLLIGFGAKAGFMPLHFWLPGAHANAPTPVSALMSAIMLKIGLYGMIRMVGLFQNLPAWFGWLVLLLGLLSALFGVSLALIQKDLKRLLAMSSIENIGIIMTGLGVGYLGLSYHHPILMIGGFTAALLHAINHAIFKQLLFLGSGVVIHAVGTRVIERMGGLAKQLPVTSWSMLVGVVAICGLPPLNGFVGEFILYYAVFGSVPSGELSAVVLVAPILAMVGALSVLTFLKLFGTIFLGAPRSVLPAPPHEDRRMTLPLVFLAFLCFLIAFGAPAFVPLVAGSVAMMGGQPLTMVVDHINRLPLFELVTVNLVVLAMSAGIGIWYAVKIRGSRQEETWGCGYHRVDATMQYSGSSCSEMVAGMVGLADVKGLTSIKPHRAFPAPISFSVILRERLLDSLLVGSLSWIDRSLGWFRRMQNGQLHLYIMYIFITLTLLMLWGL